MLPNFPGGILLGGEKTTGWKPYVQTVIYFQIIDPYDPRPSSNDNNPKIINDTSKIPYLLKVLRQGRGPYCFVYVNVP